MVGWPTVEAIVGNKIAPGLLDAYLARTCLRRPDDRRARGSRAAPTTSGSRSTPTATTARTVVRPPVAHVELAALGGHEPRLARPGRRRPGGYRLRRDLDQQTSIIRRVELVGGQGQQHACHHERREDRELR